MTLSPTEGLLTEQLVQAVLELGPSTRQAQWHTAENSACAAVQGLMILQHRLLLPPEVQIRRPRSPIIAIDEAEELYAMAAPGIDRSKVLRPLLVRLMVANDGDFVEGVDALWALFQNIETFSRLDRGGAEPQPHCPSGQAIVGRERLYITSYRGWQDRTLDLSQFSAAVNGRKAADVLRARDRNPAPWTESNARRFEDCSVGREDAATVTG